MSKRFLIILAACIAIFIGILAVTKHKAAAPTNGSSSKTTLSDHKIGAGKKGVTLTEYGDFQCPACYQYFPIVEQVRQKYGDDITFQFRNFPLVEIHQNALVAARAAEAASMQGKFFDMYQKLYENQPSWESSTTPSRFFEDYATQLGLNIEKFREDSKSDVVNNIVQADRAEAKKLGFSGTPSFLINDKPIEAPRDVAGFSALIDAAIKEKNL